MFKRIKENEGVKMSLMRPEYPNLKLLEYKTRSTLSKDYEFMKKLNHIRENKRYAFIEFDIIVFPQIWESTCTGFDLAKDGSAAIGGCAITKEYTTVLHEKLTDTYVVCFGERLCYLVSDASSEFYDDLNKRQMAGLSQARKRY